MQLKIPEQDWQSLHSSMLCYACTMAKAACQAHHLSPEHAESETPSLSSSHYHI